MTNGVFASLAERRLLWLPELGIGYLGIPPTPGLYGASYWQKYLAYDQTDLGIELTEARLAFVLRHWHGPLVDVGIGGGLFLRSHNGATGEHSAGWDVNPEAIKWLHDAGLLRDPRHAPVAAATMWDSIEHMEDPCEVLDQVEGWAFISTPIYRDGEHARQSKHYRPGEHIWYFTARGLVGFMLRAGFELIEHNSIESDLGREDIGSFAFRRVKR